MFLLFFKELIRKFFLSNVNQMILIDLVMHTQLLDIESQGERCFLVCWLVSKHKLDYP